MAPTALPPLEKLDPAQAWQAWQPSGEEPFNLKWAGHLYRRATFGGTLAELHYAVSEKAGLNATLDRLFSGEKFAFRPDQIRGFGETVARTNNVFELRGAWWFYFILNSGHPLREKMTLFWHNHFATSINKVKRTQLMMRQNDLLRRHAPRQVRAVPTRNEQGSGHAHLARLEQQCEGPSQRELRP